ncbi:MAG TPA: F0F1 ATP synthase subunit gamma [Candidatus Babeliales bacterium]|nr:F0F1 ATP synthase subunit gamma [Candidatus Babeliales bacterium]
MSQLIAMRQRIRAIETIKKITHAMQLISMSLHTRLQKQALSREQYRQVLLELLQLTQAAAPNLPVANNAQPINLAAENRFLLILISAQKGLCGNFNSELLQFLELYTAKIYQAHPAANLAFITVGTKKVAHELQKRHWPVLYEFNNLKIANLNQIGRELFQKVQSYRDTYYHIRCVYTKSHNFFARQPMATELYPPFSPLPANRQLLVPVSDYLWPESPTQVHLQVNNKYLHYILQSTLFDSLLAEQAARFRSMDNASRNASELLESSYRDYNKLRQHKITKELIELATAFQR